MTIRFDDALSSKRQGRVQFRMRAFEIGHSQHSNRKRASSAVLHARARLKISEPLLPRGVARLGDRVEASAGRET